MSTAADFHRPAGKCRQAGSPDRHSAQVFFLFSHAISAPICLQKKFLQRVNHKQNGALSKVQSPDARSQITDLKIADLMHGEPLPHLFLQEFLLSPWHAATR
jgi:hypothetical protein